MSTSSRLSATSAVGNPTASHRPGEGPPRFARHNPDHVERILGKINDWQEKIEWGRVPQEHLTNLVGSPDSFNFYRERVGNAGYRIVYEISGDVMTVLAVLPKTNDTYDLERFARRMQE